MVELISLAIPPAIFPNSDVVGFRREESSLSNRCLDSESRFGLYVDEEAVGMVRDLIELSVEWNSAVRSLAGMIRE